MNALALVLMLAIPPVDYVDDARRARSTGGWKGAPTILVPMYTRCPSACALIVESVKRGVQAAEANPATYRVVLFSFDERDTPADLEAFRERHRLPLVWTLASASPRSVRALMDSVDFQYTGSGGQLAHPNQIIFLSPDMNVATRLLGTTFTGAQIDGALATARGGRDWMGRYGPYALAVLLLICTLSAVYLTALLIPSPLRPMRRSSLE